MVITHSREAEHAGAGERDDEPGHEDQPAPSTSTLSRPHALEPLKP
jgi:hypothetical protein